MINIFLCFRFLLKVGITLIKYIRHQSCNPISMQIVVIFSSILPFSISRKFLLLHMRSRDFLEIRNDLHSVLKGRTQVMQYNQTSNAEY